MRAWCTVSIPKYLDFWRTLRQSLQPKTLVMAVVKANGYGLGSVPLAQSVEAAGLVDWFGVATVDEAIELRENKIQHPILILSEPHPHEIDRALANHLYFVIYTPDFLIELGHRAMTLGTIANVHLKIDTGMNRLGCEPSEAAGLITRISEHPCLSLTGIMTHLACADTPEHPLNTRQIRQFETVTRSLNLPSDVIRHAANSAGTHYFPSAHFDMVRVGIDSYTSIMTLHARILRVHGVCAGESVSYGGTYIASKNTQIATISIGYADGVPRSFSGEVLVQGQRCPVIGRVCMDMLMVDVGTLSVTVGDTITLVGTDGAHSISVQEYADFSGRITYESLTSLGRRVERFCQYG